MLEAYIKTFLWACTPLLELRFSIPAGVGFYELSLIQSTIISIIATILITIILALILPKIVLFCDRHIPLFDRILKKIFEKTRAKHSHRIEILGEVALLFFIAVPLPGSGAWTGVIAAYLFGVSTKKTILLVSAGVTLSGIIVAILTFLGFGIWDIVNGGE